MEAGLEEFPWAPFESEEEWELARWSLVESSGDINRYLKLDIVFRHSSLGKRRLRRHSTQVVTGGNTPLNESLTRLIQQAPMKNFPGELIAEIAKAQREEGEDLATTFAEIKSLAYVNRLAYTTLLPHMYRSFEIRLVDDDETGVNPTDRLITRMVARPRAMIYVKYFTLSGLIEWHHDESTFQYIHTKELDAILRLLPNLRGATLRYLEIIPPTTGEDEQVAAVATAPLPVSHAESLRLRWIRFRNENTMLSLHTTLPSTRTIHYSNVYWGGVNYSQSDVNDLAPGRAYLIDVFPPWGIRTRTVMSRPSFISNLTYLYLGSHDGHTDIAMLIPLWEAMPLEEAHNLETLAISVGLAALSRQRVTPELTTAMSSMLWKTTASLSVLELHLLADSLLGPYADAPIEHMLWDSINASRPRERRLVIAMYLVDLDELPANVLIPYYVAYPETIFHEPFVSFEPLYMTYNDWNRSTHHIHT